MRASLLVFLVLLPLIALPLAKTTPLDAQQGKSPDEMKKANRAAAILLSERMRKDRPGDYVILKRIRRRDVLVVRGEYDHVDQVLRAVGVPYTEVSPAGITRRVLGGVRCVLVNCPGRIPGEGALLLKEFVENGGFLFTTDWAVLNLIESCFPRTIRYNRRPTRDDVVAIRVVKPEHLFLRHVLTGNDHHLWWLEGMSYPVDVLDRQRVEVLIESEEMRKKYGAGAIAVTFRAGRGRVVHIVSHFYLQRSELRAPRDKLRAKAFAGDLGFSEESDAVRRLDKEKLGGVPAGKLRSAYSAQQFLANLLIEVHRDAKPVASPTPRPPTPQSGAVPVARRRTMLHDAPGGAALKPIPKGLRLRILSTRDGWTRVVTPAGETGWIATSDLAD